MTEQNNETALYGIIVRHISRFDVIGLYAESIKEKISVLVEDAIEGCKPDTIIQHCGAINLIIQDIIKQTELCVEDIPQNNKNKIECTKTVPN